MTEAQDELPLAPDSSRLGAFYRRLALASAVVLVVAMFLDDGYLGLGYVALAAAALGELVAFVSMLVGMRWLDRQPRLGGLRTRDYVLLALAATVTFAAARALLQAPDLYWVYWAGLGALLLNAVLLVRCRARGAWTGAVLLIVFLVAPVLSVRSSAIARAVKAGATDHARLFLWFGADSNLQEKHFPLLLIALREGDLATARLLLDHGADPNGLSSEFMARTPALSVAVGTGRIDLVQLLLDRGADPGFCNEWGETALGRAARAGQASAAELLLSRGADPNLVDRYGKRPIDKAREAQHSDVERLLTP